VKEAQALHESGFQTTVIALRTLDSVEPRDQSILQQAQWRCERIDLRSKPLWKLRRLAQLTFRAAHVALGIASLSDHAFSALTQPLTAAALRTPADLYIAHYPPALPAAAAAARRLSARYAFDAEDYHLGDWPNESAYDSDRYLLRSVEGRYLAGCAYVTASSPGIADAYVESYGIARPHVILNVFPISQAPAGPTAKGTAEPGPSVYWFSQVIAPNRGLECAVRAVGRARTRPHLYLRGSTDAVVVQHLNRIAAEANAEGRIHVLPLDVPNRMERLAAAYDVGLIAETGQTRNRDIALTNKLFTYLLAGIPAIMSEISAHRAFAAETAATTYLFPVEDPAALAAILDFLLGNPERLTAARAEAYRLGQERYNWDIESKRLVEIVTQSLGSRSLV